MHIKTGVLAALGALVSSCLATEASCGSQTEASVYYFNTEKTPHDRSKTINYTIAMNVIGDFVGARQERFINAQDAHIIGSLSSSSVFSANDDVVVLAIDNLKADSQNAFNKIVDNVPAFSIAGFPDSSTVDASFGELANILGSAQSSVDFTKVREGLYAGFDSSSNSVKMLADLSSKYGSSSRSSLEYDFEMLELIAKYEDKGSFLVHLSSLADLSGLELEIARQQFAKSILSLSKTSPSTKIAVISIPEEFCEETRNTLQSYSEAGKPNRSMNKPSMKESPVTLKSAAGTFSSLEKCNESTNSCSGHGECKKSSNGVYSCVCGTTYNDSKKKTTRWGGNACQKKDISVETQLFLWTGIVIVIILVWSLQLLFSIGSDPLPGVLSAIRK